MPAYMVALDLFLRVHVRPVTSFPTRTLECLLRANHHVTQLRTKTKHTFLSATSLKGRQHVHTCIYAYIMHYIRIYVKCILHVACKCSYLSGEVHVRGGEKGRVPLYNFSKVKYKLLYVESGCICMAIICMKVNTDG